MPAAEFPFEALDEAVAEVDADGGLQPLNSAMRSLLQRLVATRSPRLDDLCADPRDRATLLDGVTVSMQRDGASLELRLLTNGARRWLLARTCFRDHRHVWSSARQRALADLAGSLTHELANCFGAAIGIAEMCRELANDAGDRQAAGVVIDGVRRGMALTAALERQLRAPARRRAVAAADEMLADVIALFGKAASHGAMVVEAECDAGLPALRADTRDAVPALLHALFLAADLGAAAVQIRAVQQERAIAGGRPRRCVQFQCRLQRCEAAPTQQLLAACSDESGWLEASLGLPHAINNLLVARIMLQRQGGALAVAASGDEVRIDLVWPAVAAG